MARLPVKTEWNNLDAAFASLEGECTEIVRGLAVSAWKSILHKSPQYNGRLVVSWSFSLNAPEAVDRSHLAPPRDEISDKPFQAGDWPAISIANSLNAGRDKAFKLGDFVYITNGADHGQGPYAAAIEVGEVRLRFENRPGQPITRTVNQITARYSAGMSRAQAAQLKLLHI